VFAAACCCAELPDGRERVAGGKGRRATARWPAGPAAASFTEAPRAPHPADSRRLVQACLSTSGLSSPPAAMRDPRCGELDSATDSNTSPPSGSALTQSGPLALSSPRPAMRTSATRPDHRGPLQPRTYAPGPPRNHLRTVSALGAAYTVAAGRVLWPGYDDKIDHLAQEFRCSTPSNRSRDRALA
jgi:hypothetical protein